MQHDIDRFPSPVHDHQDCVRTALDAAALRCERHGARFTSLRRRVLELVWTSHEPVGAYGLLDTLRTEGHAAAPPTVYRALEFLIDQGLVHRLERLNAFVGCPRPDRLHSAHFLICTDCGRAAEMRDDPTLDAALLHAADTLGFSVSRRTIEIEGLCPDCRQKIAAAAVDS
jgi:Fur family zinc uptake transcriptional regulator